MTESTYNRLFPDTNSRTFRIDGESRQRTILVPNNNYLSKGSLVALDINKLTSKDIPIFALQTDYLKHVDRMGAKENAYILNSTTSAIVGMSGMNKKLLAPFIETANSCLHKTDFSIGTAKDGTIPLIVGKYYIEDAITKEILFVGVVDKSGISSFNTITNYKTVLNKPVILKNNRDLPLVKFYISRNLFTQGKYKAIYSCISPMIDKLANEEFEIIMTTNIRGKFEQLYRFPQFKEIDEMDNFMTQCFINIIKKAAEENKTKIKLTQLN